MTRSKRRLAPRQLFVLAGLLVVALTAYCDRHLLEIPMLLRSLNGFFGGPLDGVLLAGSEEGVPELDEYDAPTQDVAGVQALRRALAKLDEAREAFTGGFGTESNWPEPEVLGEETVDPVLSEDYFYDPKYLDENDGWRVYWQVREKVWPAYAAAVEAFLVEAREAQELDPNNGVFDVMAGLIELDLCMELSPVDPAFDMDLQIERGITRVRVSDPERLERALQSIEQGLACKELTFRDAAVMKGRAERFAHVPSLRGMVLQVGQAATLMMPELMNIKLRLNALTYLAGRARVDGRSGERPLRLGRKVALRNGAETTSLIGLLVAIAELGRVDDGWLREAAASRDVEATLAAHEEIAAMQRLRESARRLNGTEIFRLGTLDALLTPAGGWGSPRPDFATNRLLDYAFVESFVLWTMILIAGLGLIPVWLNARNEAKPGVTSGGSFTLGDLLGVVLPSLVGAAAFFLLFSRLHPSRELGFAAGNMPLVIGVQLGALVGGALIGFFALLRRASLASHGLPLRRPGLARWSLVLAALGVFVGLFWVGPYGTELAPLCVALIVGSVALGGFSGLLGKPHADPEVGKSLHRFEGRVGLACLGATLCLLGAIETVLVTPRREALTEDYTHLAVQRFLHEAEYWGGGEPRKQLEDWLLEAPERPTRPGAGE